MTGVTRQVGTVSAVDVTARSASALEINGSAHATGNIFADGQNSNHHSH